MSSINRPTPTLHTHEGAVAKHISPLDQLRRTVLSCMLWEDAFYEDGVSIAERITTLSTQIEPSHLANLAITARSAYKLRHVPLLLIRELARQRYHATADVIAEVIQRPDELTEFLALYWQNGKCPLSAQVKKGLARAFTKFDAYQLAKYNRDNAIKLRDVLFLSHAKPKDETQAAVWKALIDGNLATPDTWETNLSAGGDKREVFTRLLSENKLGYLALLRNLRNMHEANVDPDLIQRAILKGNASRVLPFRFVSAAQAAPAYAGFLDMKMQDTLRNMPKLSGHTRILVDVSDSMLWSRISERSTLDRLDAAAALAVLVAGISSSCEIFAFSEDLTQLPSIPSLALISHFQNLAHEGTYLGSAIRSVDKVSTDRLIVITDEQSHDRVPDPIASRAYMINVASYRNGVGYGAWTHIDGFSEAVISWIQTYESAGFSRA